MKSFARTRTTPPESIEGLPVTWEIEQRRLGLVRLANNAMELRADVQASTERFIQQAADEHGLILTDIVRSEKALSIAADVGRLASSNAEIIEQSFRLCDDDEQALLQSLYGAVSIQDRTGQGIPVSVQARQHLKADY